MWNADTTINGKLHLERSSWIDLLIHSIGFIDYIINRNCSVNEPHLLTKWTAFNVLVITLIASSSQWKSYWSCICCDFRHNFLIIPKFERIQQFHVVCAMERSFYGNGCSFNCWCKEFLLRRILFLEGTSERGKQMGNRPETNVFWIDEKCTKKNHMHATNTKYHAVLCVVFLCFMAHQNGKAFTTKRHITLCLFQWKYPNHYWLLRKKKLIAHNTNKKTNADGNRRFRFPNETTCSGP